MLELLVGKNPKVRTFSLHEPFFDYLSMPLIFFFGFGGGGGATVSVGLACSSFRTAISL